MESYQAIYDAVRSRISGGNVGSVVAEAAQRAFDISIVARQAQQEVGFVSAEMTRPSVLYRPNIKLDGTKWCALYGENLQDGVAGFGDTVAEAMADFDKNWRKQKVSILCPCDAEKTIDPLCAAAGECARPPK